MAISTGFLFTNETATVSKAVSLYNMKETSNYGVKNMDGKTRLTNTTGSDFGVQSEQVTYSAKELPKLNLNITVPNPQKKTKAVSYGVAVEDLLRTTDSDDAKFIVDNGIRCSITIQHEHSPYITEALIGKVVNRAISALQHEDGDWRFNELANLATQPSAN